MRLMTILTICMLVAGAFLTACTQQEEPEGAGENTPVLRDFTINTSVAAMQTGSNGTTSRSLQPMGPEEENPVKSLAIIQFDSEGNLLPINKTGSGIESYYHYCDFTEEGTLPGSLSPALENIPLYAGLPQTRVCFIGNMEKDDIPTLLQKDEGTRVGWNDFQDKTVTIRYITEGDKVGHVEQIYLFGYYEGALGAGGSSLDNGGTAQAMSVVLSRLIARLEISINLGEGVTLPADHHIYFRLQNVEERAYLFLNVERTNYVHQHVELMPTTDRTDYITGTEFSTFYFYVAPHLVMSELADTNATRLLIWCTTESAENLNEGEADAKILLCNDPRGEMPTAAGAFWLNRNSIYHVNITLTYEDSNSRANGETDSLWGVKEADGSYHYRINLKN